MTQRTGKRKEKIDQSNPSCSHFFIEFVRVLITSIIASTQFRGKIYLITDLRTLASSSISPMFTLSGTPRAGPISWT